MKLYVDRTRSGGTMLKDFSSRTEAPLAAGRPFDLHVVVDRSSVEVFAQGGTVAMTNLVLPSGTGVRMEMFGAAGLRGTFRMWELNPVWEAAAK
jgi:sucrose-6-phosphate hydrolase SacC (GH32 family)